MSGRRDTVVILARGAGHRMGGPKAGLKLPGEDRTFLERILALYAERAWPATVVVGPGGATAVERWAGGARVLEGPGGGDTALTLVTAWKADALAFSPPTHYWAHPVDLPLVSGSTVDLLAGVSATCPAAVVRPAHGGRPGHPVVLPRDLLRNLASDPSCLGGPFRDFLSGACRPDGPREFLLEEVEDVGVVRDFDEPGDFDAWRERTT